MLKINQSQKKRLLKDKEKMKTLSETEAKRRQNGRREGADDINFYIPVRMNTKGYVLILINTLDIKINEGNML